MNVVEVAHPGGADALRLAQQPLPSVGAGEVLIRIAAAGLNRADLLQRRGRYPPPPGAPTHLGLEVAGTIAAVGAGVERLHVDERVCALLEGGGYAEYVAVDARQVLRVPDGLSLVEAASLPEACFTVWSNVFQLGALRGEETLLVHGGSSGIGVMAIQIATALGATVYVTAGSEEKCRFCESLGARMAIDYKRQDFVAEVAARTNDRGVDVVLDIVGGRYLPRNVRALAIEGRLVVIAVQSGVVGELDLLEVARKRLVVTGSLLRPRSAEFKGALRREIEVNVWPLIEAGRVKPVVDRVFPLREAAAAHAYMESGVHKGKIVLEVAGATAQ
ncbi:MAG: NAD(P)H-quinone oxidoreductase [Xanthomonadaceae bacterium]|nr:NAD(P)H-quinone oxidoreductase [Xanthomonadaceae bacterium]